MFKPLYYTQSLGYVFASMIIVWVRNRYMFCLKKIVRLFVGYKKKSDISINILLYIYIYIY